MEDFVKISLEKVEPRLCLKRCFYFSTYNLTTLRLKTRFQQKDDFKGGITELFRPGFSKTCKNINNSKPSLNFSNLP